MSARHPEKHVEIAIVEGSSYQPGTGITSAFRGLAKERRLTTGSSGIFHRALATMVEEELEKATAARSRRFLEPHREEKVWWNFVAECKASFFDEQGPKELLALLSEHIPVETSETVLGIFNSLQAKYANESSEFLNYIPDILRDYHAVQVPFSNGYALEGKLVLFREQIIEFLKRKYPRLHYLKRLRSPLGVDRVQFFFTVSEEESAWRVLRREIDVGSVVLTVDKKGEKFTLDKNQVLEWINHRQDSDIPVGVSKKTFLELLYAEFDKIIEKNRQRIERDSREFAKTYAGLLPSKNFEYPQDLITLAQDTEENVTVIDTTESSPQQVIAQLVQIVDEQVPWLPIATMELNNSSSNHSE